MARPIIHIPGVRTSPALTVGAAPIQPAVLTKPELERRLRQKRSRAYVEAMTKLDAGSYTSDPNAINALIAAIQQELPEIRIEQQPLGIIARCYLGGGHDVHTLDRTLSILTHFKTYQPLPALLERGRSLALHTEYAFVEVYVDSLRAVRCGGEISVLNL